MKMVREDDVFIKALNKIEKNIEKGQKHLKDARYFFEKHKYQTAYEESFEAENYLEKAVLKSREAPVLLGKETAREEVDESVKSNIDVDIGLTPEGWFFVKMPALLPKKEKGDVNYIRGFLYPAMKEYFRNHDPILYEDCFIAFKHIYDEKRPIRQWRDHDNIEVNIVTDIIALYTMYDDNPHNCSHLYCSVSGKKNKTEVYVAPKLDIVNWIQKNIKE